MYLLTLMKLALRPWRVAPGSQLVSAGAVGSLLCIAGFLLWMEQGLKPVIFRLQSEQVVTAYLSPEIKAGEETQVLDVIRTQVGARAVESGLSAEKIQYRAVGVDEFVGELKQHYPDLSRELEVMGEDLPQLVPRYVSIAGTLPAQVEDSVRKITGVESAESSRDRHQHIVGAFKALRWLARLLTLGLAFALLNGLIQLAKLNGHLHQETLALLKLWGSGPMGLRTPGMTSGFFVGIIGGGLAALTWSVGAAWLASRIVHLSPMLEGMPHPSWQTGVALLAVGGLIGLVSGVIGHSEERA